MELAFATLVGDILLHTWERGAVMSVEPRRVAKTEVWTDWESRVVNGLFPLRRFLGGSNHSAVFLTECKAENLPEAAIKFVPADTLHAEAQLVQWGTAATLSHPHLVRLFDVGRCQFGGRAFLYVVMEYAEQTLAQILPKRALSPDEALEMMLPTLDALTFLHQNSLVHGQLKPSNFLVVKDQLKLSSDTIRASGSSANNSINAGSAATGTASDIWDLGITLVEALTQRTPIWTDERSETAILPVSLPLGFVDTVRRCLSRNPANRPSVVELEARYNPAPHLSVASAAHTAADEEPHEATPSQQSPQRSLLVPVVAAVFLLALGAFAYLRYLQSHSNSQQVAVLAQAASQEASSPPPDSRAATAARAATADGTSALPALPARSAVPIPVAHSAIVSQGNAAPTVPIQAASHLASAPATQSLATPQPTTPGSAATPTSAATPGSAATPTSAAALTSAAAPASARALTSAAAPAYRPPAQPAPPLTTDSPAILHEETPDVPPAITARIRGHVKVTVRVLVDPYGKVVGEFMENAGPSRYFARLASDAAGKWQFIETDNRNSRVWLLRFEFTRGGTAVQATTAQ
jgi:serine/threonine protein kinase